MASLLRGNQVKRLLMRAATKALVLILALGLSLGTCSRSFARDDDPDLLNQQVLKLYQEGKYQEAIPIAEKLLAIREKQLGLQNPETAGSLNSLATLYFQTGAYEKAEPLYQQALQIRQKTLGPEHPDTATSLHNLAGLYYQMRAYAKAEPPLRASARDPPKGVGARAPRHCHEPQQPGGALSSHGRVRKG